MPSEAMRRGDFSSLVSVRGGMTTRDVAERLGLQWQPVTIYNQYEVVGDQFRRAPLDEDWSVSTYDVKHAFSASVLYELPFGKNRRFLADAGRFVNGLVAGWSISGVGRIQGGVPLVPVLRDDNRLAIEGNVRAIRPDLVPGVPLHNPRWSRDCPVGQNCEPWFNPAAFMRPAKGTLGNAPRTIDGARWPTTEFLDLSIQKNFNLRGRRRFQLRVDAINALNHPVFRMGRDSDNG